VLSLSLYYYLWYEINYLVYTNQLKINQLNRDLTELRDDYAEMIRKSYKSRSEQSRAMFLLSSENFLQAYKRAQYMKQYASYRKMQGDEIKQKSSQLIAYNEKIGAQKQEKEKLIVRYPIRRRTCGLKSERIAGSPLELFKLQRRYER
jgi:septal ring factor EnvC (AmiA/AmiB activator)